MKFLLGALAFVAPLAIAQTAHAGIEACGNIHIEAEATCELQTGIECEGMCEPVTLEAQCTADLTIECRGQCEGELSATAECTGSCEADCVADCEVEPAEFDCRAECQGSCEANADASCGAGDGRAECLARAEASCDAECSGTCDVEPGTADCEATCQGSCQASCEASAEAYLNCQGECQGPQLSDCTAELQGGCEIDCNTEEGALFCDGSYIDHGDNLAECRAALRALFEIEVTTGGEASCSGNECEASGFINCSCTADPEHRTRDAALLTLAGLFLFGIARRRRRAA